MSTIAKILTALAVLVGLVLVFVMYGDKIKAFCKKLLGRRKFNGYMADGDDFADDDDFDAEDDLGNED